MPDSTFYDGLNLAEQLAKFNDHHHAPVTRHTSGFESKMLDKAVEVLSDSGSKSDRSGGGAKVVLMVVGLVGLGAVGVRALRSRRQGAGVDEVAASPPPVAAATEPEGDTPARPSVSDPQPDGPDT